MKTLPALIFLLTSLHLSAQKTPLAGTWYSIEQEGYDGDTYTYDEITFTRDSLPYTEESFSFDCFSRYIFGEDQTVKRLIWCKNEYQTEPTLTEVEGPAMTWDYAGEGMIVIKYATSKKKHNHAYYKINLSGNEMKITLTEILTVKV